VIDDRVEDGWANNSNERASKNVGETELIGKAAAKINDAAQRLVSDDFAALRCIKRLSDWHNADYTLYTAREFNGITKDQYNHAVSIFAEWWHDIHGV
jgi:hypothetical protein